MVSLFLMFRLFIRSTDNIQITIRPREQSQMMVMMKSCEHMIE